VTPVFHALSAPRRQEILRLLWVGERSAGEIHRAMGDVTFGAVSQHLRVLREAGLVTARGNAQCRMYSACKEGLGPLRTWLEGMWAGALYDLKIRAEMEEARRGPRSKTPARKKKPLR
jgi:DNA-binding transcriptional ArsR family regulator